MTAGMNINDIRGDACGAMNLVGRTLGCAHMLMAFGFHIRPSFYHAEVTHIYPTFRLGWLVNIYVYLGDGHRYIPNDFLHAFARCGV